jgi:hypothetical protein
MITEKEKGKHMSQMVWVRSGLPQMGALGGLL